MRPVILQRALRQLYLILFQTDVEILANGGFCGIRAELTLCKNCLTSWVSQALPAEDTREGERERESNHQLPPGRIFSRRS